MFPLKLARKWNAFLIMRCARSSVVVCVGGCRLRTICWEEEGDVEDWLCEDWRDAICAVTLAADSMEIPMVISAPVLGWVESGETASMSTSAPAAFVLEGVLILKIALSLPG